MTCPQCADFLRPGATSCRECGWGQPATKRLETRRLAESGSAWSPPTPHVREFAEPIGPRWHWTPEMQAECDALRAKLKVSTPTGRRVDPEMERRYLEAAAAKKAQKRNA